MKAEKLILGNFITMDEVKPFAKAVTVRGGRIQYVGSLERAESLCDEQTIVLDYGENFIYPGFMEAHAHATLAGQRHLGQADVSGIIPSDKEKYRAVIRRYIADHPDKDSYWISGWTEDGNKEITSEFLDEICSEKPMILITDGGHAVLLNRAARNAFGITKVFAFREGTDLVHVDENGEPTGYLCEKPAMKISFNCPISDRETRDFILDYQKFAFEHGVTAFGEAGVELNTPKSLNAYFELDAEDALKIYSFGYLLTQDNDPSPEKTAKCIAKTVKEHPGKHFKIVGAKVFLDGVVESHTAWLEQDYCDKPGYHGTERYNDREKLSKLIGELGKYGLSVHAHTIGDGAVRFLLDCIETGQRISGNMDQRNALAHLQLVRKEDIRRMADTNSVAVVPPLWTPKFPGIDEVETGYLGKERNASTYPIRSFMDAGALTVFHSDYPISANFSVQDSIYYAINRSLTKYEKDPNDFSDSQKNPKEIVTRKQALLAMTLNVAAMFHEEANLGSIAIGKIANFTVMDTDFLTEESEKIPDAQVIATLVDGEEVYRNPEPGRRFF